LGDKKALSFEVAQSVSQLSYSPNEFDVNKKRDTGFFGASPFPRTFDSGQLTHTFWGVNDIFDTEEDLGTFIYPFRSADILYICFSLVNRPSLEKIAKVGKMNVSCSKKRLFIIGTTILVK
jgi:hypothetical protein